MPWIEIALSPHSEWNEDGLKDWALALGAFLNERGTELDPQIRMLPGYNVVQLGVTGIEDLTISSTERLVILRGLSLNGNVESDFARFVVRFALQMGALGVCVSSSDLSEKSYWRKLGGVIRPDPVPLMGSICREKVGVKQLYKFGLLVTYEDEPILCLEPIACNAHSSGTVSLAQRRLEKMYGGSPIGFASRMAAHCPWIISKVQWTDLLSFSRLQAFEILAGTVNKNQ
ncbi:hypothetical protein [Desulfosporosinus hippei]|uniref:Uncharacterized protein n=1 Tax=Desulfosporosinus hippei DSM 8344 TaxID=1121419 RepID=A0A1G7RV57_9FIRM|nr:hypothetical protein [Desulfosporosinus hippei]SDG14707.1 hypothetical protein SAMN05443529_101207 [Desulfosporosinus hippei DSM 8344]